LVSARGRPRDAAVPFRRAAQCTEQEMQGSYARTSIEQRSDSFSSVIPGCAENFSASARMSRWMFRLFCVVGMMQLAFVTRPSLS